jgi:hypothetical protein
MNKALLSKLVFVLVFLASFPFGIYFLIQGSKAVAEASESSSWPITAGEIISSFVKTSTSTGAHHGTSYDPEISFTYSVAGKNYSGTAITPGRNWRYSSSYRAVHTFPTGTETEVYYSPADPTIALLMPGLHYFNFGKLLNGLLICTFTLPFGIGGFFAVADDSTNSKSLTFRDGSPAGKIFVFLLLAAFLEFFLSFWLS